jgi:uncharacterized membrane protein YgcG
MRDNHLLRWIYVLFIISCKLKIIIDFLFFFCLYLVLFSSCTDGKGFGGGRGGGFKGGSRGGGSIGGSRGTGTFGSNNNRYGSYNKP